jgi:hypothetical protein
MPYKSMFIKPSSSEVMNESTIAKLDGPNCVVSMSLRAPWNIK